MKHIHTAEVQVNRLYNATETTERIKYAKESLVHNLADKFVHTGASAMLLFRPHAAVRIIDGMDLISEQESKRQYDIYQARGITYDVLPETQHLTLLSLEETMQLVKDFEYRTGVSATHIFLPINYMIVGHGDILRMHQNTTLPTFFGLIIVPNSPVLAAGIL